MLDLLAGDHDLSAALNTADLEVHAHAQDEKAVVAAGVRLLHDQFIINVYIHKSLPLNTIPIYCTTYWHKNQITLLSSIQHVVKSCENLDYILIREYNVG